MLTLEYCNGYEGKQMERFADTDYWEECLRTSKGKP